VQGSRVGWTPARNNDRTNERPFWGGGAGFPHNTMWPGPRSTYMQSFILIHPTVWPQYTNVTDRQTDNSPIAWGEPFYKRSPKNQSCSVSLEVRRVAIQSQDNQCDDKFCSNSNSKTLSATVVNFCSLLNLMCMITLVDQRILANSSPPNQE